MAQKRSSSASGTRIRLRDAQGGTPPSSAAARRLLAPLERSLQAQARTATRERRAAQTNLAALQAPLVRLVSEQANYERLARQQRVLYERLTRQQRVPEEKRQRNYLRAASAPIDLEMHGVRVIAIPPPYDYDFTTEWQEPGSHGVPYAERSTGKFGGHSDNVAVCTSGVGVFFRPAAAQAWVRSISVIKYGFYWVANSHFMAAHTYALIGVYVVSQDLAGGNVQVNVDTRTTIYDVAVNTLTGQSDEGRDLEMRPTVEFLASNQRQYFLWTWCGVRTWGNDRGPKIWSQAYGNLNATTTNIAILQ